MSCLHPLGIIQFSLHCDMIWDIHIVLRIIYVSKWLTRQLENSWYISSLSRGTTTIANSSDVPPILSLSIFFTKMFCLVGCAEVTIVYGGHSLSEATGLQLILCISNFSGLAWSTFSIPLLFFHLDFYPSFFLSSVFPHALPLCCLIPKWVQRLTVLSVASDLEVEFKPTFPTMFHFHWFLHLSSILVVILEMLLSVVQSMIYSNWKTREIVCLMGLLWIYTNLSKWHLFWSWIRSAPLGWCKWLWGR